MSILPKHKPDANLHSLANQPYQCPERVLAQQCLKEEWFTQLTDERTFQEISNLLTHTLIWQKQNQKKKKKLKPQKRKKKKYVFTKSVFLCLQAKGNKKKSYLNFLSWSTVASITVKIQNDDLILQPNNLVYSHNSLTFLLLIL